MIRYPKMNYIVPKSEKEFWGSEFMDQKGEITKDMIVIRIKNHVKFNSLKADDTSFHTDETLQQVLKTTSSVVNYSDILSLLGL